VVSTPRCLARARKRKGGKRTLAMGPHKLLGLGKRLNYEPGKLFQWVMALEVLEKMKAKKTKRKLKCFQV